MPEKFGRYEILSRIASGGMAEVYKAQSSTGRVFAIKKIHSSFTSSQKFITMFIDEAKIMVSLRHPNIVQLYEFGRVNNEYFLAMEWVDGRPLSSLIRRQLALGVHFPIDLAVFIVLEICCGLEYAHGKRDSYNRPLNIVHRDLSPPNILISREGEVKIADFGIAKARGKVYLTQPGVLKGKFSYMSPEQARGEEIDQRSDIFSTGIILHELLTGRRLFLSDKENKTIENVRRAKVEPPSKYNPDVPKVLDEICLKALAKRKNKRYQTASELASDLEYLLVNHYKTATSERLKSFLQYLYPHVAVYDSRERREEVVQQWEEELKESNISRWSRASVPAEDLPSMIKKSVIKSYARPALDYWIVVVSAAVVAAALCVYDFSLREPYFMHTITSMLTGK